MGIEALIPVQMKSDLGGFASTAIAAIKHDAAGLGADVGALAKEDFAAIWAAIRTTASNVVSDPVLATDLFTGQVSAAVAELGTDAAKSLVPALKVVGKNTLTTLTSMAVTTAKAAASQVVAAAAPVIADVNAAAATAAPAAAAPAAVAAAPAAAPSATPASTK